MRKTIIAPWTPEWAERYEAEARLLSVLFGELLVDMRHVGSTSVPAIGYAKPTVDIAIAVRAIGAVDRLNAAMAAAGYDARGESGIPGRRYFRKGEDNRTHHVHVFAAGDPSFEAHLRFKAYLEHHPEDAAAYGQLKLRLAERYPDDIREYQAGKQAFVTQLARKATEWANCRGRTTE